MLHLGIHRHLIALALTVIGSSSISFANTGTIGINGVNGNTDSSGAYIAPYTGPFNGNTVTVYCDDLAHDIIIGATPITVNISHVDDLSLTRFGGPLAPTAAVAKTDYEQIFYLSTLLGAPNVPSPYPSFVGGVNSANSSVAADIQDAIWTYFDPATANAGTNQVNFWMAQAFSNYQNYNYSSFSILTDAQNQYNGVQELFINSNPNGLTPTPEPSTWGMLAMGCGALGTCVVRRRRAQA